MSPEERKKAREKYKQFKELPPEKRKEVKEKWRQQEEKKQNQPNGAPTPPSSPTRP
jgi:hypothetical protein